MFDFLGLLQDKRLNQRSAYVLLALMLFAAMSLIGTLFRFPGSRPFDHLAYLLTALTSLPLMACRSAPVIVTVITALAYAVYLHAGFLPGPNMWGCVLAFYIAAIVASPRKTAAVALLIAAVMFYSGIVVPEVHPLVAVVQAVAIPTAAWTLGGPSRQLRVRNRQLAEITRQLRHEQEQRTEQALVRERLRIARELHDVVAHHMSVISMHAGLAGYVFDSDPPTARAALDTIGRMGREALEDMRRLLNLLRPADTATGAGASKGDPPQPAPGLDDLPALFDRVQAAGVEIHRDVSDSAGELPSGLQLTAYRVIQEALTNVIKHAAPCRAKVCLRHNDHELVVTIANDGPVAEPAGADGGHGLIGIRERARLYGGSVTAEPRSEGGFVVALTIPTDT